MVKSYEEINRDIDLQWIVRFDNGQLVAYLEGKDEYAYVRERNPQQSEYLKYSRYLQDRAHVLTMLESLNSRYNKEWDLVEMIGDALRKLRETDIYVFMDTVWVLLSDFTFREHEGLSYPKNIFIGLREELFEHVEFLESLPIDAFELTNGYEEFKAFIKPIEYKLKQIKIDLTYLLEINRING